MRDAAIRTEGLTKHYGRTEALQQVDLEVRPGEVFGFLGPNGAGKTTTIRLLLGLLRPTAGTARVLGMDPWADAAALHRRLSYLSSDLAIWPHLTGAENLELIGNLHGGVDTRYRDVLTERFDFDPHKRGRAYSRGNAQKIGVIAAFMTRPELLILDEPTTGLDPLMAMTFRRCVDEARERGQTVFLSSHVLSEVEALCDRVAIVRRGRLVDVGTLGDLRHLSATTVELTFDGPPPPLDGIAGVDVAPADDGVVRCEVRGPVQPLLDALAGAQVRTIASREPSLEEVFLRYYGEEER
jgi:ABC-2 type transport system ATP-binding protein